MKKRYTPAQKAAIVLELLREAETLPKIAARHEIHPNQLYKWKAQALDSLPQLFASDAPERQALTAEHERKVTELYAETHAPAVRGRCWSADHPTGVAQKKIWSRTWGALNAWRWLIELNPTRHSPYNAICSV